MQIIGSRHNSFFQDLSDGVATKHMSRIRHQCVGPATSICLLYGNYYWNGSNADTNGANNITVKASIEYPSGTFFPVTFGGSTTTTITPGSFAISDQISGLSLAAAGDFFYSRTWVSQSAGEKWPIGLVTTPGNGEGVEEGGTDKTASGTVATSTSFSYSPSAVLGTPTVPVAAVAIVGDSIALGYNDTNGPWADRGFLWRAFGTTPTGVYVNGAKNGAMANEMTATNAAVNRLQVLQYATDAICEFGINDIITNHTDSLVTIKANLTAIWTMLNAAGVARVYQTTITPSTTSADSWATTANQTTKTGETVRTALNDWIRTTPSPLTGYLEVADIIESARNSGKFIVTGAANYATTDGIHPTPAAHALIAAAVHLASLSQSHATKRGTIGGAYVGWTPTSASVGDSDSTNFSALNGTWSATVGTDALIGSQTVTLHDATHDVTAGTLAVVAPSRIAAQLAGAGII
jgi:lysophospholipase L1-like esterase